MKLILGASGQLGRALRERFPESKCEDIDTLDITDSAAIEGYDWEDIDMVINAAAYTNVDGAETAEGRVLAWRANALAPGLLARAAATHGFGVVHFSTDYVFDGTEQPHAETEAFSPLSVYGSSKAAGDIAISTVKNHYILRTSWVIGDGNNFVRTMLRLGEKGVNPSVVSDQIGRLTFTETLVDAVDHILSSRALNGTYNITNQGDVVSWADITREVFALAGYSAKVTDTTTASYFAGKKDVAARPLYSELDLSKIRDTGLELRDWRDDLKQYIDKEMRK